MYVLRKRRHFWKSIPAPTMLFATSSDVTLAGFLMAGLPAIDVAATWLATSGFAFAFGMIKLAVFARV